MNKYDIQRVIARLEPDNELEYRLAKKLGNDFQRRISFKPIFAIAAGLVMLIGAGFFAHYQINSNTRANLSMKNQKGNVDHLVALLPDNKATEKPALTGQDDHSDSSGAPQSGNKAAEKPALNNQAGTSDSSSASLSGNRIAEKPALNNQAGTSDSSSASLSESEANGTPGLQNSGAEIPKQITPENKPNSEPRTMLQNNSIDSSKTLVTGGVNDQAAGIYLPKVQLPDEARLTAKMMGLIVYQGRIYLQSAMQIDSEHAEKLVGEKLGTTKGTITEWSKQADYAVNLASTVGIQDVYTVKGYNTSFRIMTYEKINGAVSAYFFECLNDITVKTGHDVFGKFKLENNIESVQYEDFASWNNGKGNYKFLTKLDDFNNFLAALEDSLPHDQEGLASLFDDQSATDQKFLYIKLNDGSEVQLRLFKDGYVHYNGVNIFFKLDGPAFNSFWNGLE